MTVNNYIVATAKSWNIGNFYKLQKEIKTDWLLITRKRDLSFEKIKDFNPEYIFFPHWSWIIPEEIYESFKCIIFHMTDLPFGRGGSPLQNLIERGIYKTKISALKCIGDVDAGPIYLKRNLSLSGSAKEIFKRASGIIFEEMIPHIIKNKPEPTSQKGRVVLFKRRTPGQSDISSLSSLRKVYDYVRMLDAEGYPNAFIKTPYLKFEFADARLKKDGVEASVKITFQERKK